jgi:hypothetical protein
VNKQYEKNEVDIPVFDELFIASGGIKLLLGVT